MPHAVVVGTDATALHVAGQLVARGFELTLLEASQAIGGKWVQRLFADSTDSEFNAVEDGIFLDFPFNPGRTAGFERKSTAGCDVNDESIGNPGTQHRVVWPEQAKPTPSPDPSTTAPPSDQQLLRHLADYAYATGLHRKVRLGCTLRRAKWQAMNGCWRLELNTESVVQRGGAQLSADLLVVSRQAVAGTRLPHLPGSELYCGTVLTANDQLSGPGGSAVLEQQLRGRNVLVVGPRGPVASGWAEACRHHAGCGGSVVLLEMEDEDGGSLGASGKGRKQGGGMRQGTGGDKGRFSRLFGTCFGLGRPHSSGHVTSSQRRLDTPSLERFSPAQAPCQGQGSGNGAGGDGGLLSPERGSGTSGVLDDAGGLTDDELKTSHTGKEECEGATEGVELDPELAAVGRLDESATGPTLAAATGVGYGGEEGRKHAGLRGGEPQEGGTGGGGHCRGGDGGNEGNAKLAAGRSSLRVLRGVGALLNGAHVMLSTGEELPAEVVLLVPLGGVETNLAFLDASGPLRLSQTGGSSVGGSFRRTYTQSLAAASASSACIPETISRHLDVLYRDMLSNSPFAPNFALVGMGPRATQHDARMAAVQAAWLLSTWVGLEGHAPSLLDGAAGRDGGGAAAVANDVGGGIDPVWPHGVPTGGFMRQASPVEANADAALRARWRREAAKRGNPDLYDQRYLQQLLADLGASVKGPSKWPCGVGAGVGAAPTPDQLSRQRVAKLLGLKRLRRTRHPVEDALGLGQSSGASTNHSRMRVYSCGGVFGTAHAAASAAIVCAGAVALEPYGSGPPSREASRSSHQVGFSGRCGICGPQAMAALREHGISASRSGAGCFDASMRSEGSCPAFTFSPQGDGLGKVGGPPTIQQITEGCFSTGSYHGIHHHHHHHLQYNTLTSASSINNNNVNNNSSLSFALGSNQLTLSHDVHLYRVLEHPAEHLGDAATSPAMGMRQSPATSQHQHVLPSCPSSPSLALAAAMYTSAGSISGSIGSLRGRLLGGNGMSCSVPAGTGGASVGITLASSVATSPCALVPHGGGGGGGGGAAGVETAVASNSVTSAALMQVAGTTCGSVGCCGDESIPLGGSQQRLRSQLLQRHRSTSRLAGVSNASSIPSAPQQQVATSVTQSLFFARRSPAVSTSQVSLDIPKSFLTDRRSHSGRPSNASTSSRRGNNMSAGGGGGGHGIGSCSTGSLGLIGRANSAVRLQLLLAAASSASRRRTAMTPPSPASAASSELHSCGPSANFAFGVGESKVRLRTAYSEALGALPSAVTDRSIYGGQYSGGPGFTGGKPNGMGTSVAVIARAHRISNGPSNAHGSVSEPVAGELTSLTGSAPASPSLLLHARNVYLKDSDAVSEQLPVEEAAVAAAAQAAEEVAARTSGSDTTDYTTGEQQWSEGEPSFQLGDRESQVDDAAGLSIKSIKGASLGCRVGHHRTRCRSITLPDLRFGGGNLQHSYTDHFHGEEDGYGDNDGGGGGGGGGASGGL